MRVVPTAWWYAGPLFVLAALAIVVTPVLGMFIALGGLSVIAFFRDPDRSPPAEGVLAPADGRVSFVRDDGDRVWVGIFMNVFDVHVNRSPVSGTIEAVTHRPGGHLPAFSKSSDRNERVRIELENTNGAYTVDLIAGTVARRITPYVEVGSSVERSERIGHIAFGSRVDVRFPPAVPAEAITVSTGDRLTAGETVIATEETLPLGDDQSVEQ